MRTLILILFIMGEFSPRSGWSFDCLSISEQEYQNHFYSVLNKMINERPTLFSEIKDEICWYEDCSFSGLKLKIQSKTHFETPLTLSAISLYLYSVVLFDPINRYLRSQETKQNLNALFYLSEVQSCALKELPSFKGLVHRVVDMPDLFFIQHQVGSVVQYNAFTSTTEKIRFIGYKTQLHFHSKTGKSISAFSYFPEEAEVLFDQKTCFKILKNELFLSLSKKEKIFPKVDRNYSIELEEIQCPKSDLNVEMNPIKF